MAGSIDMVSAIGPLVGTPAVDRTATNGAASDKARLAQASRDLESLFIYHMLQQMRATVPEGGLLSGGRAETMYREMLDSELAKSMAAQKGMGLARMMHDNLVRDRVKSPTALDEQAPDPVADPGNVGPEPESMINNLKTPKGLK